LSETIVGGAIGVGGALLAQIVAAWFGARGRKADAAERRKERQAEARERWGSYAASTLAQVRLFLAEADPMLVTVGVGHGDIDSAIEVGRKLSERRDALLYPLTRLTLGYPDEDIRAKVDRLLGGLARVHNYGQWLIIDHAQSRNNMRREEAAGREHESAFRTLSEVVSSLHSAQPVTDAPNSPEGPE
jgi:hypothetical protein